MLSNFLFITHNLIIIYRPCDRNMRDVELIACRLRRVEPLCRLTNSALQQLAMCGFYEDLEKGVTCKSLKVLSANNELNKNKSILTFLLPSPSHLTSFVFGKKVFRAGEQGRFWYAVLGGQLEVRYHTAADGDTKVST